MTEKRLVPFGRPWIEDEERRAVDDVLRGPILTHGPQCKAFEKEFAEHIGPEANCVSVSSCMAALHLAYLCMGIGPGDEVIVPAQTHVATAHAVELVGATPIFCDCEPTTGNVDASLLEGLITPRTRAISVVHFVGIPCEMDAVVSIAKRHDLKVVEDCAIALGARYGRKHVGLFGDVGCFSFYPVKHITTAEGGMFVTRHREVAEKAAKLRGFGVDRTHAERPTPGMYDVAMLGLNYRMSELHAALGRVQLRRVGDILGRRRRNFDALEKALADVPDLRVLCSDAPVLQTSPYVLSAVLKGRLASKRGEIIQRLGEAGIGTSIYYPGPVPKLTYYREKYGYAEGRYPHADEISTASLALPVGPHLSEEDVQHIAGVFVGICASPSGGCP